MQIFTIGFTRKNAHTFFSLLRNAGVGRLLDVRLNNTSQLAAFTRRDDLHFFCGEILRIPYEHLTALTPTRELLASYRETRDWAAYERGFLALLEQRAIEHLPRDVFDGACLLCSEAQPDRCHRRLAAEYLQAHWPDVSIVHL